jgi:hypothetical protein
VTINASGDKQAPLDVIADRCVESALKKCDLIAGFASEEREDFVDVNPKSGKYVVVFVFFFFLFAFLFTVVTFLTSSQSTFHTHIYTHKI